MKKLLFLALLIPTLASAQVQTRIWDGSETADVKNTGSSDSLAVAIVDGSGNQITSFGGGTEYTEGDTDASITGKACLMEGAANALVPLQGTAADGLLVNLGANNDVTVTGVSTSAKQDTIIGHVDGVEGLLGTIDADTGNISTKIDTVAGAVSGTEMQVDVLTMPTVTVNSHAVTNAGTFAVQVDGAALTALQLLDDVIATLGTTTYTETATKGTIISAVRRDADTTLVDTTNEVGPLQMDANGRLKVEAFSGETLPVSLASVPSHAVTNAGTFAVQVDGSALTALQLIDDSIATTASAITSKGTAAAGTDGTNARILKTDTSGELQVDVLSMPTTTVTGTVTAANTAGDVAHDAGDSGNPVKIGGKARSALPSAVANGDRADLSTDLWGRALVAQIDPAMQTWKSFNATTTQTGTDVWSPASGKRIAVTSIIIGSYGTTACRLILWAGANADTTFSAGTDLQFLAASFAPSSSSKPGLVLAPSVPLFTVTADHEIHVTTDAGCSVDITVWGYEF